MVSIRIFGKKECSKCSAAKKKIEFFLEEWGKGSMRLDFVDLGVVDGLTEACMKDATDIPTTIVERDGNEVLRWKKKVPESVDIEELKKIMEG